MSQADTIQIDSFVRMETSVNPKVPVLIGQENSEQTKFPFTENLSAGLNPDWIFYFSIGMVVVLAWIKLIYGKFIINVFSASINYQVSLRLFKDANLIQKRISLLLFGFYFLNSSVLLFLIFEYFEYNPAGLHGFNLIFGILGFLIALVLWRILFSHLLALVFNRKNLLSEALFQNFIFNKLSGLFALPFILIISYTKDVYLDIALYLSIAILISINVLRLLRAVKFVWKNVISYFYFILYLCSLEILPLLVVIKIIISLS